MLKDIDLTNKCGSCCNFKAIGGTTQGECLQNPYGEDVVHDPEHPYWIVQRSRIKCRLYNTRPQTNADRIRAMSDEELAQYLFALTYRGFELKYCQNKQECMDLVDTGGGVPEENCIACLQHYLQQPEVPDET